MVKAGRELITEPTINAIAVVIRNSESYQDQFFPMKLEISVETSEDVAMRCLIRGMSLFNSEPS